MLHGPQYISGILHCKHCSGDTSADSESIESALCDELGGMQLECSIAEMTATIRTTLLRPTTHPTLHQRLLRHLLASTIVSALVAPASRAAVSQASSAPCPLLSSALPPAPIA